MSAMADERAPEPESRSAADAAPASEPTRCPWCSADAPVEAVACPSCGASFVSTADASLPGVTAIDAEAILRSRNAQKGRGGLLGFLSGENGPTAVPSEAELASLAPPTVDVQTEILRLELNAERQRLESEAAALAAEESEESRSGESREKPADGGEPPGGKPPSD